VVAALELDQVGPAGDGAGEPDRLRGRLAAAHRRDHHLGGRDELDDQLGELDLGRRHPDAGQVDPAHRPRDGLVDHRRVVAEQDRPERGVVVEVALAVGVGDVGAVGGDEHVRLTDRPGGGVDPARNDGRRRLLPREPLRLHACHR